MDNKNIIDNNNILELFLSVKDTIETMQPVIWHIRRQNYFNAMISHNNLLKNISKITELIIDDKNKAVVEQGVINEEHLMNVLNELNDAQQDNDYILLADLYELMMLPMMYGIQAYLINEAGGFLCDDGRYEQTIEKMKLEVSYKEVYTILKDIDPVEYIFSQGIFIEPTISGHLTIAVTSSEKKYYLQSNSDVYREALQLASYWYDEKIDEYIIYGLGLGYHIQALASMCGYSKIKVYENNAGVICSAAAFGVLLELIEKENIEIIYDSSFNKLNSSLNQLPDNKLFIIHTPSLYNISETRQREAMEFYSVQYHSLKAQKKFLDGNFKRNVKLYDAPADTLSNEFEGKDIYLVAAGPSLDKNVHQLKTVIEDEELKKKSIILAVGTVFKKLLTLGIVPDYIVASDAKPYTYMQIKGIEDERVPLLGISTLYYKFFENYKGKKYIIFQKGYAPSEQEAKRLKYQTYETGGSVITVAFDASLKLGGRRVILLGADFAYTGGEHHADGTHMTHTITEDNITYVKDIYGNDIAAGKNLCIYRKWIEDKATKYDKGMVIDATEGGAYIKGTVIKTLYEVINEK